ncbi:hypothetical protein BH24BAC1_BH24BAC1_18550 [soil metagenome]
MKQKTGEENFSGPPQVIVLLKEEARGVLERTSSLTKVDKGAPEANLQKTLKTAELQLVPLFGNKEEEVASFVAKAEARGQIPAHLARMNNFYLLETASGDNAAEMARQLNELDLVEAAYVSPRGEPPVYEEADRPPGALQDSGDTLPITNEPDEQPDLPQCGPGGHRCPLRLDLSRWQGGWSPDH